MGKNIQYVPILGLLVITAGISQTSDTSNTLNVNIQDRSLSKLPFIIAEDQEIYEKYGLDVDIRLSGPEFDGGIITEMLFEPGSKDLDLSIEEHSLNMMSQITIANSRKTKAIGSVNCHTSGFFVGKKDVTLPYDFKGKRIGVSYLHTATHYAATLLAKRKNLDPIHDFAIIMNAQTYDDLERDVVDVVVMSETGAAVAVQKGYKILEDTGEWNEASAGDGILVEIDWLKNEVNHAKATNFLAAVAEALVVLHNNKQLTLDVLKKWYGIKDPDLLEVAYAQVKLFPEKPFVCVEGIKSTLAVYKSNNTNRYTETDFYDDRFLNELVNNEHLDLPDE